MGEWLSTKEAEDLLQISECTVLRSLTNEDRRAREWGAKDEGWRLKPLVERTIFQLRRSVVEAKARGEHAGRGRS